MEQVGRRGQIGPKDMFPLFMTGSFVISYHPSVFSIFAPNATFEILILYTTLMLFNNIEYASHWDPLSDTDGWEIWNN